MPNTGTAAHRNEGPAQPVDWVSQEFAQATLPDRRHRRRLQKIATAFAQKPTAPIPQACGSLAEAKAAYRFMENEAIMPAVIRNSHHQATLQRIKAYPLILAVQDTTVLDYTTHPCTQGLGPTCHTRHNIGLLLHSTLAITPTGQPLGFLHNAVRARSCQGRVSSRERRPLADKESYKWVQSLSACQGVASLCPETMLVNITDREGDLYELFVQALSAPARGRVELLVRARHDRKRAEGAGTLWEQVARQPVGATLQVRVGRHGDHPRRLATLSIRFCAVELKAPKRKAQQPALRLWAIQAQEVHAPKGTARLLWQLLTTLPVTSATEAIERVRWYAQRWQIEVLHKVLKSGCKIEQRQLETARRLERALSIDLVVAWHILALCKAARELPDDPISDWLPAAQWQTLWCYVHQRTRAPKKPPSVRQAVRWIAQLGGFLGRKSDGEPGPTTLWRGLQQLQAMTKMWELCHATKRS
jgi:hypothetical protein